MKKKGFKDLMSWSKPYLGLVFVVLFLSFLSPFLYSFVPQFITYVVDNIFEGSLAEGKLTLPSFLISFFDSFQNQLTAVVVVGVTLVGYQLLRGGLMFINGYSKGKLAEKISYDIRTKMYSHIQDLPFSYHNNADTGDLIQRCTSDNDTIKTFLSSQLPELIYIMASFGFGALQLGLINTRIMLVTLAVVPISITSSIIYFKYVKKKFEEIEELESDVTTTIQENVNGVRVVKAFANENYEINKFGKKNRIYADESRKLGITMANYWGFSDLMTNLQYAFTITVAVFLVKSSTLSAGQVIASMMYIGMLVWPIRGLGRIIGDFGKATVAANRIHEILDIEDDYHHDGKLTPQITGNISFQNVSFKFKDSDEHLLKHVNFEIKAGETIAIIGKTGSGKSTIVSILARLLEYQDGSIVFTDDFGNQTELKDISKKWIRRNIGVILQEPFLYAASVYDNIKIALNDVDRDRVMNVAKMASVHEDITNFEKGYDTLVGEKGVTLSGGQKQRLAIARMLLLEKPIIIFDDSLSAVDTTTDLQIRSALKNSGNSLTSIIITHRITTAKEADKIIVLENGKIAAVGRHEELAKQDGLYKRLWDIQGALENEFLNMVETEVKSNE